MSAALGARAGARPSLGGAMKLARLLEMPEREFEARVRQLEANPLFPRLLEARAVRIEPYCARFAARKPDGRELSMSGEGLSGLLDGRASLVDLIRRIGQDRFEEFFLGDANLPDERRAEACAASLEEVRQLRELVDRVYIQGELETPSAAGVPAKVFSSVAGVELDGGRPVIAFFNREIWKGRYRLDGSRLAGLRQSVSLAEARRLDRLVCQLELLDRRKSTLYRVLEALLDLQKEFLTSGDPSTRRPLTQLSVAKQLDVSPSVLNRLVSNKSIRLPWGFEAPLKVLMPSAKRLILDRFDDVAVSHPSLSDEGLRGELARRFGARLSRRSVAQYRKELGLGGMDRRQGVAVHRPGYMQRNIITVAAP